MFFNSKVTGLHINVSPGGKKAFYFDLRTQAGVQKRPKLGDFGIMTVEQARNLARGMLGKPSKGDAPTKRHQGISLTFTEFFEIFDKNHNQTRKAKHSNNIKLTSTQKFKLSHKLFP